MTTCNHTLNHLAQVNSKGYVVPCCHYIRDHNPVWDQFQLENLESLDGILNSNHWQQIRQEISSGDNYQCSNCWNREQANGHSKRMWANEKPVKTPLQIEDLEIALDTTCNMMCRICQPAQSSKWASATVLPELDAIQSVHSEHYSKQNTNTRRDLYRVISNTNLQHVNAVRINGGEPFYSKRLLPLLEQLDKQAGIEQVSLAFNTNGSIFPNDKVLDILSRAQKITIDVSVDAIGDLATQTRNGIEWQVIENNIQKIISHFGADNIRLSSVVSLLNVNRMQELYDYIHSLGVKSWTWQFLSGPKYLSVFQFPKEIRSAWQIEVDKNWRGAQYNEELMSSQTSEKLFDLFLTATNILDNYHGCTFQSVNPEMYNLIMKGNDC